MVFGDSKAQGQRIGFKRARRFSELSRTTCRWPRISKRYMLINTGWRGTFR